MGMLVTVVTLYDDSAVESYVAVIHGTVAAEQRRELAESLSAHLPDDLEDEDDQRILYFREVETCDSTLDVTDLPNVDGRR
jgi:hypothetical protein